MKTYTLFVVCNNCNKSEMVKIRTGTKVSNQPCSFCGCKELVVGQKISSPKEFIPLPHPCPHPYPNPIINPSVTWGDPPQKPFRNPDYILCMMQSPL